MRRYKNKIIYGIGNNKYAKYNNKTISKQQIATRLESVEIARKDLN